jgi:hypothetical protein
MLDKQAKNEPMKTNSLQTAALDRRYGQLRQRLSQVGYLSQGSVQDRTARQGGGAGYQWTRKVARKTVSVSLTQEQFEQMRKAVENYRQVRLLLAQMEKLSRRIIFQRTPHPDRRKRLSPKVLGTN